MTVNLYVKKILFSETEIKKRFSTMRTTYQNNLKRSKQKPGSVKWIHFPRLKFLSKKPLVVTEVVTQPDNPDSETEYLENDDSEKENDEPESENDELEWLENDQSLEDFDILANQDINQINSQNQEPIDMFSENPALEEDGVFWTDEKEEVVIDFYEAYPELWDHKDPNYKKASKSQLIDILMNDLNGVFSGKFSYLIRSILGQHFSKRHA